MGKERNNNGNPINFAPGHPGAGTITNPNYHPIDSGTMTLQGNGVINFGDFSFGDSSIKQYQGMSNSRPSFSISPLVVQQTIALGAGYDVSVREYKSSDTRNFTIVIGDKKVLIWDIFNDVWCAMDTITDLKNLHFVPVNNKINVNTENCSLIKLGIMNTGRLSLNLEDDTMLKIVRLHTEMDNHRKSKGPLSADVASTDDDRLIIDFVGNAGILKPNEISNDIEYALKLLIPGYGEDSSSSLVNQDASSSLALVGETYNPEE